MKNLISPQLRKFATFAVILTILLQVQSSFACEMMDTSGPAEHCCCDEMKSQNSDEINDASECCEFSSELTLKGADLEDDEPIVIQVQSGVELPQPVFVFVMASLWPPSQPDTRSLYPTSDQPDDPGNSGTHTYSVTQRFRI